MNAVTAITKAHIQRLDALRKALLPVNSRLFLLKRTTDKSKLISLGEIDSAWYSKFNTFRGQMLISIGTLDDSFADLIAQASFIGYGVPNADLEIDVYSIEPDRRDVVPPDGGSPFWKIFVTRDAKERFIIPQ
jgi:hypothetical protein